MKLWKKISLLCSIILIVTVSGCSAILLRQVRQELLSSTLEQAIDKQRFLVNSFEDMAGRYLSESDSHVVERVLMEYCFSRYADSSSVLMAEDKILYSQTDINPGQYLAPDGAQEGVQHQDGIQRQEGTFFPWGAQQQFFGEIGGRHILIVGSSLLFNSSSNHVYSVYVVEDVTPVYESTIRLFWQFVLIGAACIVAGLLLIALLVRRSVLPLAKLQTAASRIAAGNYSQRAVIHTVDEVGMLAADFNRMAEAVERHIGELTETANRQQLFIGGVTHEFKTPLTALILGIDTLQNTYMNEEERMDTLERMDKRCKWLERLVQKLWKLLTLHQEIEPEMTSVPILLESVRESVEENLNSKGIALEIQCKTKDAVLDTDLMHSVLANLVENAAKASEKGQTVILSADDNLFEVRDSGVGIRQEELGRITEPFYMVDKSRSKKYGGAGLGLALVKEIVEAHNGKLEIESVYGEGTVVRVRLQP